MIHPHPLLLTKITDIMKVFRFSHTCTDMEILHIYDSDIQHVLWGGYFIFSSRIPNPNNQLSSHLMWLYFRITWEDFLKSQCLDSTQLNLNLRVRVGESCSTGFIKLKFQILVIITLDIQKVKEGRVKNYS